MKITMATFCVFISALIFTTTGSCSPTPYQYYEFNGSYADSMGHWNLNQVGSPSVEGNYLSLDGDSYLVTSNVVGSAPLGISHNNFTVTAFFMRPSLDPGVFLFTMSHMAPYPGWPNVVFAMTIHETGKVDTRVRATTSWQPYASSVEGLVIPGEVYHYAAVYDGTHNVTRIYINGILVGSANHTYDQTIDASNSTDQRMYVGAYNQSGNIYTHFTGYIDELKIFHTALTDQEVLDEYTMTSHDILMETAIPEPASVILMIFSVVSCAVRKIFRK